MLFCIFFINLAVLLNPRLVFISSYMLLCVLGYHVFQDGLSWQCNVTGHYRGWGLHSGSHCRENLCLAGKKCKVFELINVKNF